MQTLSNVLKRENNNFDLIRSVAALAVVFSHSFHLFNAKGFIDPSIYPPTKDNAATLAVYVFFFLSGTFITNSLIRSESITSFIIMRILRIYPAIIICISFTIIIGLLLTTDSITNYLTNRVTWAYYFHNITLFVVRYHLPGVFENNSYPNVVNGSIWTLPIELTCYLFTFLIGYVILLKNYVMKFFYLLVLSTTAYWLRENLLTIPVLFFATGSLCCLWREKIVIDRRIGGILLIIFLLFYSYFPYLFHICLLYNLLVLGSLNWFMKIKLPGDFSYGVYIYSFFIQQILALYFPGASPYNGTLLTIPLVLILAGLSWFIIELPALKFGKSLITNKFKQL
jgi:peptidoglycan/LPS O-acetylase OafA/YrhL